VVIDNLHIVGIAPVPLKADAPLIVDADAVLAGAVAPQPLQTVARWHSEVGQAHRRIYDAEFPQGHSLNSRSKLPNPLTLEEPFGIPIPKALNHPEP
jgi:hypothetical protein